MKKNGRTPFGILLSCPRALMRASLCLALFAAGIVQMAAQGQTTVTLHVKNESLPRVIEQLRQQSGYEFVFNSADVTGQPNITLDLNSATLNAALTAALRDTDLEWTVQGRTVVIRKRTPAQGQAPRSTLMSGRVVDANDNPIVGVTVMLKGTNRGTMTDGQGHFNLVALGTDQPVLQFSFVGMEPQEATFRGQMFEIMMLEQSSEIEEVVITGVFDRRAESHVGSAVTLKKEDLDRTGALNLIQGIKNLDPSFNVVDNFADGSNPNVMPEIRLRGQSGFPDLREEYTSNPNQPLFILDGFEVSLTRVMDMDMNRVESVTILKDAAAKAIYGSKAANGVVVIETHRPKAGQLRLTYTGSLTVTTPDLSSYNLTNAAEKLDVEKTAGRFTSSNSEVQQYEYDMKYNQLLENVLRGVDTDWLSKPLRTGIGHKHVIYLEGGDERMVYGVDISYNNVTGAMKGSNRNTVDGGVTLAYRYKSLTFRNHLTVTYNKGENSPYGQFSDYARANPYYSPRDEYGNITKILDVGAITNIVPNPLWNSTINTKNFSEYAQISNNLYVDWVTSLGLRVTGRFSTSRQDSGSEVFLPASHTSFVEYTTDELKNRRGRYTYGDGEDFGMSGDINANYSRSFGRHMLFGNVGWSISSQRSRYTYFVAEGFPNDYLEDITFARQYMAESAPTGSESATRNIGVLGALNYSFEDRYLFDASFRMSASSQFGKDNRWGKFWSVGAGWNLHNEPFMENVGFVDKFKIRGSIGFSGSENFSSYQSKATYSYNSTESYLDQYGTFLRGIENPALRWQRKYDKNVGLDATLFNNRFSLRFDYYVSDTDDLMTDVTVPPSTGFQSYKANLGEIRNTGLELYLSYRVWNGGKGNFANIFGNVAHNKNTVRKISNSLAAYNDLQTSTVSNRPIVLYIEGQSLNAIWAVRSYGIDPASGDELYVRPDGTITKSWSSDDLAVVGDEEPEMRGNFGFNIDWFGFSLNVSMNWQFGGQIYNQTLVDKIENVDYAYNVDRRVFSERWREPGDVTRFKRLRYYPGQPYLSTTRATERFVEDRNEWSLAAVNFSYDFGRIDAVRNLGLDRLRLTFNMNDVVQVSSVRIERGTSYPFARSFSFSLQAMF